jgi:predicted nucleic acid-binding protein
MGLTHLDAGVLIAFLDGDDAHHVAAREAIRAELDSGARLAMAASALAECLVGPARRSARAVQLVREVIDRVPVSVVALDEEIATRAATLRARHRALKLPDALVIATADSCRADRLITTDRRWPTPKALKMTVSIDRL